MIVTQTMLTAAGGAMGAVARAVLARHCDSHFPWATFLVNALGSMLLGFIIAHAAGDTGGAPSLNEELIAVGFCGGFTTFSAFSFQTLRLLHTGHSAKACANIVLNLVVCLGAFWLGLIAGG